MGPFVTALLGLTIFRGELQGCLDGVFRLFFAKSFTERGLWVHPAVYLALFALSIVLVRLFCCLAEKNPKLCGRVLIGVTLALLGTLCLNQSIRRDDYWEIADARALGIWGFIRYEFVTFCGRYFSLFLKGLYAVMPTPLYINILLFLNLCLLILGCIRLARNGLSRLGHSDREVPIILGWGMAVMIVLLCPNPWEVWFWGGGTFIYGVGITMTVWILALLSEVRENSLSLSLSLSW